MGFRSLWLGLAFVVWLLVTLAGQQTQPSSAQRSRAQTGEGASPDLGLLAKGVYRNSFFGFSFHLPLGWVERTAEMRDTPATRASSALLLSAWQRPPEASDPSLDPTVLIAAEKISTYPGLQAPEEYFAAISEVATKSGLQLINPPYEFHRDNQPMVRADFSKARGDLTVLQSTLVILRKGYVLSFTFIAESEDEITELINQLRFSRTTKMAPQRSQ